MKNAVAALVVLSLFACVHPLPNPGQVVLSCGMDAVHDPAIVKKVLDALDEPTFRQQLQALINPALGITTAVVVCIVNTYMGQLAADPGKSLQHQRARAFLREQGVVL